LHLLFIPYSDHQKMSIPTIIVGISAFYHDSAVSLLIDGEIVAAAQEERFTRRKHDSSFPVNAVRYVLDEAGIAVDDLTAVAFYDKPLLKFERLLETFHAFAPSGLRVFVKAMPVWIREKLFMKHLLRQEIKALGGCKNNIPILFPEHHLSHAASAFYPSPFEKAAILTVDGVGEWATTTIGIGDGNSIEILRELHFPHSVGLLYSAFTWYLGFTVNSGEYKLMGLAPYGDPHSEQTQRFIELIRTELVDIKEDGSLLLKMRYFEFATGFHMTHSGRWKRLFGIPPRAPESEILQVHMNLARAIQEVTEEIMLKLARSAALLTGCTNLVMAGGVALNSVANGKLLQAGIFENIWIQPAAGDAGGALGAALAGWYIGHDAQRTIPVHPDAMKGAYLGPSFSDKQIIAIANRYGAQYRHFGNFHELASATAQNIANGKVVGWFQGRMEYGPRALGNRSILGDPRNPEMQQKLNLKIKFREGFRPFAPSVMNEYIQEYFEIDFPSPYMLYVIPVKKNRIHALPENHMSLNLMERLYLIRSDLPAITHVDHSARIQSVDKESNPKYWTLIDEFRKISGFSVVINTSFNVRGEPIVCTPEDAFRCFMRTEMDVLVMGNVLFDKANLGILLEARDWQQKFTGD
jgi:carbamoyltransferase